MGIPWPIFCHTWNLEYRSPAIYHATRDVLVKLDRVQTRGLEQVGMEEEHALMNCNLAPLESKGHIVVVGVVRRTVRKGHCTSGNTS